MMQQMVYVVIAHTGEYSSLSVWVAGVYTDKATAIKAAEDQKAEDMAKWAIWEPWGRAFWDLGRARGFQQSRTNSMSWEGMSRDEAGINLGIGPEPDMGDQDSDYTVACVPLNQRGVWYYSSHGDD